QRGWLRLRRRFLGPCGGGFLLRGGLLLVGADRAPPAAVPGRGLARLQGGDPLLLEIVAGERDGPLVLGLRQVALDLLLDEQRELAVAGIGKHHAVVLAQELLLAGDVGTPRRVVAGLV